MTPPVHAAKRDAIADPHMLGRRPMTGCPQRETRPHVRRLHAEGIADADEGEGGSAFVGNEPAVDLREDGTAPAIGGGDMALVCPDGLLQHREQETPFGRRSSAGSRVFGEDEVRGESHATGVGPGPYRSGTSSAAASHEPGHR
jgi:hypothetical protein